MVKSDLIIITTLTSILIPILLIVWISRLKYSSTTEYLVKFSGIYLVLYALYLVNNWSFFSYYLGLWWLMIPIIFLVYKFSVNNDTPWVKNPTFKGWAGLLTVTLFAGFAIHAISQAWAGKSIPENAVELEFPLKGWRYHIVHGGSNELVNAHVKVTDSEKYRGQTWAYDIVQMGWLGNRAQGIYPSNLERYHIFSQPVYAPCDGTVEKIENELPDLIPPESDRENLPGNFVQINCSEAFFVILAHLKQYTVEVSEGDTVLTSQLLGRIGNSGNTSEPHLHIHAQKDSGGETLLASDPLPIVFMNSGFLTRNDIVRNR